jgi:ankyrin repeat protein
VMTPLILALRRNKLDSLDALLANGADPQAAPDGVPPPLTVASFIGNVECIKALLKHGARVDAIDPRGGTALIAAAFSGHAPVVEALAKAGANVDALTQDGMSALLGAARSGHVRVLRVLLQNGADANLSSGASLRKATPTMLAAQCLSVDGVTALVNGGGDPDRQDANGKTALDYAAAEIKRRQKLARSEGKEHDDAGANEIFAKIRKTLAGAPRFGMDGRARSGTGVVSGSGKFG